MRVHTGRSENTWRGHTNTYTHLKPGTPTLEQEHKHKHREMYTLQACVASAKTVASAGKTNIEAD